MTNFTTVDAIGALRAIAGFSSILLAPGFVFATATDLFGFRKRSLHERVSWAVALSFALAPITCDLAGRLVPFGVLAAICYCLAAATILLLVVQRGANQLVATRSSVGLLVLLAGYAAIVIFELIDLQRGNGLYLSVTVLDQAYRVGFTNAVAHYGIPPPNPFFHGSVASPLRYYYFWYMLCALLMKVVGVSARQALMASSVWAGLGLVSLVALSGRHFLGIRQGLDRFVLVAALLLSVTGLDLLPVLFNLFVHHDFSGDLEWWSVDQVASWQDSILWVPNHVASLLCSVTAFLLLWRKREPSSRRDRIAAIGLAGAAAASAFGLSIYVAVGCAAVFAGWTLFVLLRERDPRPLSGMVCAALAGGLLVLPLLRGLVAARSGTQGGASAGAAHLFSPSIRRMIDPTVVTGLPLFHSLASSHPALLDSTTRFLLLLPGYAIELGVFGFLAVLYLLRWKQLSPPLRTAVALAAGALLLVSFVRSSVIGNNDFGYRAALLPSFFLLLLAADWMGKPAPRPHRRTVWVLLSIGLAGTGFQALMLRVYVPLHVSAQMPGFVGLPEAAFAARTAYASAADRLPAHAIVQSDLIDPAAYFYVANMLYTQHAMSTDAAVDCGAVFGGDPSRCAGTQAAVRALFAWPVPPAAEARAVCARLGIDYLAAASTDPAWRDSGSWVWTLPLAASSGGTASSPSQVAESTRAMRIVSCRGVT